MVEQEQNKEQEQEKEKEKEKEKAKAKGLSLAKTDAGSEFKTSTEAPTGAASLVTIQLGKLKD